MPTGRYRMRKSLRPYVRKDIPMTFSPDTRLDDETAGGIRYDLMVPGVKKDARKVEKGIERSYRLLQKGTAKSEKKRLESKGKASKLLKRIDDNPEMSDKRKARLKRRAGKIQARGQKRAARVKQRLYTRAAKVYQRKLSQTSKGAAPSRMGNFAKQQFEAFGPISNQIFSKSTPSVDRKEHGKVKKVSGYDQLMRYRQDQEAKKKKTSDAAVKMLTGGIDVFKLKR